MVNVNNNQKPEGTQQWNRHCDVRETDEGLSDCTELLSDKNEYCTTNNGHHYFIMLNSEYVKNNNTAINEHDLY